MKDRISMKTLLLIVAVSAVSLCIIGCERIEAKKSIATIREESVTSYVNIQNSNGSTTPVIIRRQGSVWVGPKGEQYTSYPTVEQLKPIYGF